MSNNPSSLERIPYYEAGRGPIPLFDVGYMEELARAWGREWGAQNSVGTLEMVLVHRPGDENLAAEFAEDPGFFNLPEGQPDLAGLQAEHDSFCDIMRSEGCEVVYLDPAPPLVGTYGIPLRALVYARTATVIDGGAIMDRNANHYKRGMERFYSKRLTELGCPILYTVHGNGSFEASDLIFINPTCVALGRSVRTNDAGMAQVMAILRQNGIEDFVITDIPGPWRKRERQWGGASGYFHLDNVFGMAAEGVAVVHAGGVGYHFLDALDRRGVEIVEVPEAEVQTLAQNLLVLKPGVVLMPANNPSTAGALEAKGIKVHQLEMPELLKAGGGPKCITMPLVHR